MSQREDLENLYEDKKRIEREQANLSSALDSLKESINSHLIGSRHKLAKIHGDWPLVSVVSCAAAPEVKIAQSDHRSVYLTFKEMDELAAFWKGFTGPKEKP